MRIAFLGLGRLGLPIAAVLSQHHAVTGFDPDPRTAERLVNGHDWEVGLSELLGDIALTSNPGAAIVDADVVLVAVPTPHHPDLDGTHPTTKRAPFDLTFVESALRSVGAHGPPVVLLSTVLPGDCRKLAPLVSELIYSPSFIAMGTTIEDFLDPEFVLHGAETHTTILKDILNPVIGARDHIRCSWETAELTKMAYNTAIGLKIGLANTVGWLAHETGADGGQVMAALARADRRIASGAYLKPGLGDGGACHPRDQIALSWLAREHGVYDLFGDVIDQRNAHSEWIGSFAGDNPIILGSAYKPNSPLDDGSPALLLANQFGWEITNNPDDCVGRTVIIGVPHDEYHGLEIEGATIIDPWGIIPGSVQPGRQ